MREFDRVDFEKIVAHNDDKYNEWANNLAQQAVRGNTVDTYV
jgi:ribonuclease HI